MTYHFKSNETIYISSNGIKQKARFIKQIDNKIICLVDNKQIEIHESQIITKGQIFLF